MLVLPRNSQYSFKLSFPRFPVVVLFYLPGLTAEIIVLPIVFKVSTVNSQGSRWWFLFYLPGLIAENVVLLLFFEGFRETVIWFFIYHAETLILQRVSNGFRGWFLFYLATAKLGGNPCSRHAICT